MRFPRGWLRVLSKRDGLVYGMVSVRVTAFGWVTVVRQGRLSTMAMHARRLPSANRTTSASCV